MNISREKSITYTHQGKDNNWNESTKKIGIGTEFEGG